jgi:hypothetical protein
MKSMIALAALGFILVQGVFTRTLEQVQVEYGIRAMEEPALRLTGPGEQAAKIQAAAEAALRTYTVRDRASFEGALGAINGDRGNHRWQ